MATNLAPVALMSDQGSRTTNHIPAHWSSTYAQASIDRTKLAAHLSEMTGPILGTEQDFSSVCKFMSDWFQAGQEWKC